MYSDLNALHKNHSFDNNLGDTKEYLVKCKIFCALSIYKEQYDTELKFRLQHHLVEHSQVPVSVEL